jgi:hypothetical protein
MWMDTRARRGVAAALHSASDGRGRWPNPTAANGFILPALIWYTSLFWCHFAARGEIGATNLKPAPRAPHREFSEVEALTKGGV